MEENMGCCAWFGVIVYVTLSVAALVIVTLTIAGNYWFDVRGAPSVARATVDNAGLWHVCWTAESSSNRRLLGEGDDDVDHGEDDSSEGGGFGQPWWPETEPRLAQDVTDGLDGFVDDFTSFFTGDPSNGCSGNVEDLYRNIWGTDYWGYIQATRAFTISFAALGLIKLIMALVVWYKNRNPLGKSISAKKLVVVTAFIQLLFGLVVIGLFTAIYIQVAQDAPDGVLDQPSDYWGWCYWGFVAVTGASLIDMIVLCC